MATYVGQQGTIRDGSNAVGEVTSFEINASSDTVETTVMGDTWKTRTATQKTWSGNLSCKYDPGDTTGQVVFASGATVSIEAYPSGNTSGHGDLSGSAIVTERNITSTHDGLVELSLTFEGDGALTETTVS